MINGRKISNSRRSMSAIVFSFGLVISPNMTLRYSVSA